jgi:phosphatidylserine decarboxylase
MPCPIWLQNFLPQKFISRCAGFLADSRIPFLKNALIRLFSRAYEIDLSEAIIEHGEDYPSFNAFFTRKLKSNARPLPQNPAIICSPADGFISEIGLIQEDRVYQAKNHHYTLTELLGGDAALSHSFLNGNFLTVYLAPKNYHRVHMPFNGTLREMIYVPGKLFSVNDFSVNRVPQLFARNERVVSIFDTDLGPMAVILVGAIIVGSIETVWAGSVTSPRGKTIARWDYSHTHPRMELQRGEELGLFRLGSTAIVLFSEKMIEWDPIFKSGMSVQMGQAVGERRS